jgi:magnesium-transporting ATPase (P-type)
MLIHQLPLDEAFSTLRSTPAGLSCADAAARHTEFGPNRIERLAKVPMGRRFAAQFTHFFAALLWVAALLALVADVRSPTTARTPSGSRRTSVFSLSLFSNRLITAGIVAEIVIILLIDYTPAGHALFGTAPLEWRTWLFVLPFAIAMVLLEEGRKAFVRSRREVFAFREALADVNRLEVQNLPH